MTNPIASSASVDGVSADTDRLASFVDHGRRYHADLVDIGARVLTARGRAVELMGEVMGEAPVRPVATLSDLVGAAETTTDLVDAVRLALLEAAVEEVSPVLRRAVLDGRLQPPDEELRDRVLAAILAGRTPDEVGIDPAYFPAAVVRLHDLGRRIDEAEAARDRSDGLPLVWWDGDHDEVAGIDRRLDDLLAEREGLVDHGIEVDGAIDRFDAVALIAGTTGGAAWEGRTYAAAFAAHRQESLTDGGLFGLGAGALTDVAGFTSEFDHLAERVATDSEVAVAFYRTLGPEATADLPSFVIGADRSASAEGDDQTMGQLSRGLAAASRSVDAEGRSRIGFGGDDLLDQPRPRTMAGVIGYSPALLFTAGHYDPVFLAEATAAALRLGAAGDPRGHLSHHGWQMHLVLVGSVDITFDGGEDPRNILLSRAAEQPEAVRAVIQELAGGWGRPAPVSSGGPPDRPGPGAFDALLRPSTPFEPTVGPEGPGRRNWLDRLRARGNREGPGVRVLSPLAYPDLADPYPITGFLGAVLADDELSRSMLLAVAARAGLAEGSGRATGARGSVISDPGVAAGLDLILGANATTMVEPEDLAAVGIQPTGLNEATTRPVGPIHWRAAVDEVRRWGRGQALAQATAGLLSEAIEGAIDLDGGFEVGRTRPFAHLAGRAEAEAHHAVLAYAAGLDGEARARNRQANRSAAVAATVVSLTPGGGVVTAPVGVGWAWFFDGYPTDAEVNEYRRLWTEVYDGRDDTRWEQTVLEIWLGRRLGSAPTTEVDMEVPGLGVGPVGVRRSQEPGRFDWRHPGTGRWERLPDLGHDGGLDLFPADQPTPVRLAISAALDIDKHVENGIESRLPTGQRPPDDHAGDWTGRWLGKP